MFGAANNGRAEKKGHIHNQLSLVSVLYIVMKTDKGNIIDFEGRPDYRYKSPFLSIQGDYNKKKDNQFVVPWQMARTKEKEFFIK